MHSSYALSADCLSAVERRKALICSRVPRYSVSPVCGIFPEDLTQRHKGAEEYKVIIFFIKPPKVLLTWVCFYPNGLSRVNSAVSISSLSNLITRNLVCGTEASFFSFSAILNFIFNFLLLNVMLVIIRSLPYILV